VGRWGNGGSVQEIIKSDVLPGFELAVEEIFRF